MAEETNAGVKIFVAGITSICGLGSDGIAALLSACLFKSAFYLPLSFHPILCYYIFQDMKKRSFEIRK